jgi:hypothetical protein
MSLRRGFGGSRIGCFRGFYFRRWIVGAGAACGKQERQSAFVICLGAYQDRWMYVRTLHPYEPKDTRPPSGK